MTNPKFLSQKTRDRMEIEKLRKGRDGLQTQLNQIETYLRQRAEDGNDAMVVLTRFFPGSQPITDRRG